jgi:hypothetical protein
MVSARLEAARGGDGSCEGERLGSWDCRAVAISGVVSLDGSIVHSQCLLRRFLRSSKIGFRGCCILFGSTKRSLMAAAWIWRSLPAFRFPRRPAGAFSALAGVESSMSDSSDDDMENSVDPSDSDSSSSEDRSECLAVYVVVLISSSSTRRKVTFFGAGKKALRPARGLSHVWHKDGLRTPDKTGLLRKILFKPSEIWYGRSSLLRVNGETRRVRVNLEPVGDAVAGEERCGKSYALLKVFSTVGEAAGSVEAASARAVEDLPKVMGREEVWRESLGRLGEAVGDLDSVMIVGMKSDGDGDERPSYAAMTILEDEVAQSRS